MKVSVRVRSAWQASTIISHIRRICSPYVAGGADLQRRERRQMPDRVRRKLVHRGTDLDVRAGSLARLAAGEPRGGGAGLIARAIAVRPGLVLREAGEDHHVIPHVLER